MKGILSNEFDRDWIFIIRRLQNQFNVFEKQLCVYVNDTVIFDESGKLSLIITMNTKPFVSCIKQIENPNIHQIGKLFNSKTAGRFLDIAEELEDPITGKSTRPGSHIKRAKTIDGLRGSLEHLEKKDLKEQRERERNNWRLHQLRAGKGSRS